MSDLIYKEEAFVIIGKCIEVHRNLGPGFLEIVYKDALEYEFQEANIPYTREHPFEIPYKKIVLPRKYYSDFTVYGKIILEAKAIDGLYEDFLCTAINYLKVSHYELCLLVNFGAPRIEFQRVVFQPGMKLEKIVI